MSKYSELLERAKPITGEGDCVILALTNSLRQLEDSNEWLQAKLDEAHAALLGLMKLTAAAYGHQVHMVPEYVAACKVTRGDATPWEVYFGDLMERRKVDG